MLTSRSNTAAWSAAWLLAGALAASGQALAASQEEHEIATSGDPEVEIENLAGQVTVRGWDKNQVHVRAELSSQVEGLDVEGGDERVSIRVRHPKTNRHWGWGHQGRGDGGSTLDIRVPHGASLRIKTVSADVDIDDLRGERHNLRTVSGDVTVNRVDGLRLTAETVSGDVRSTATTAEQRFKSVSGDIDAVGGQALVEAESVSGDIDIRDLPAEFSVGTVSGDVTAAARDNVRRARLSSTSGTAEFQGRLARDGVLELESMSGNAIARLGTAPAEIFATTMSGNIRSQWGEPDKPRYGPGAKLNYRGKGEGRIEAQSFSGSVRVSD